MLCLGHACDRSTGRSAASGWPLNHHTNSRAEMTFCRSCTSSSAAPVEYPVAHKQQLEVALQAPSTEAKVCMWEIYKWAYPTSPGTPSCLLLSAPYARTTWPAVEMHNQQGPLWCSWDTWLCAAPLASCMRPCRRQAASGCACLTRSAPHGSAAGGAAGRHPCQRSRCPGRLAGGPPRSA